MINLDYNITSLLGLVTNKGHSKAWSFIWKKDIYCLLNYWLQMTWCSPTQRSAICPGHCKPWFLWEKIPRGHWSRICPLKTVISRNCRSRPWWEPEADSLLTVCEVILEEFLLEQISYCKDSWVYCQILSNTQRSCYAVISCFVAWLFSDQNLRWHDKGHKNNEK